jgi:hypothetical protein
MGATIYQGIDEEIETSGESIYLQFFRADGNAQANDAGLEVKS